MSAKHLDVRIYGRVQGVGFRYGARERALKLKLAGFARNERDGSVYIEAEGGEEDLKKFLKWCGKGSWSAEVERMESAWSDELKNFNGFLIAPSV